MTSQWMKRRKARRRRAEDVVKRDVRAQLVERDGHCRLQRAGFGPCFGASEWHHVRKRSATVNMSPEERHNRREGFMVCSQHHMLLERPLGQGRIMHGYLTDDGADGPMWFERDGHRCEEIA